MCGRIAASISGADQLMEQFLLRILNVEIIERYNVAPGQQVLAIVQSRQGHREAASLRWGLIPEWAKEAAVGYKMINARAETVADKPAYRTALRTKRCIIPASGFYEWRRSGKQKTPYYFYLRSQQLMALAGLWAEWRCPTDGQIIRSFTILTTTPNVLVQPMHDRMPVLLDQDGVDIWLDHTKVDIPLLQQLFRPFPADAMDAYPVSSYVNSPANEGPECIARVAV